MEQTENGVIGVSTPEQKLYTQKDFDEYKANLKQELEQEMQKSGMSELELAQTELAELKQKYKQKEDECLLAQQKEETLELLKEANLDSSLLDIVLVAKNSQETKAKISALKNYTECITKSVLQGCIGTPIPLTTGKSAEYDAFIEGFDTNTL